MAIKTTIKTLCLALIITMISACADKVVRLDTNMARVYSILSKFDAEGKNTSEQSKLLANLDLEIYHLGEFNRLEDCVQSFVGFSQINSSVRYQPKNHLSGKSGSPIFFAPSEKPQYVIKIYWGIEDLSPELRGTSILAEAKIKTPSVLQLGKCRAGSKDAYLAMQELAEGKSIGDIIEALEVAPKIGDSRERENALGIAKKAFESLGVSLAKLHTYNSEQKIISDSPFVQLISKNFNWKFSKIKQEFSSTVDLVRISDAFEAELKEIKSKMYKYSLVHGDAHFGNFIWSQSNGISMIDLDRVYYSINKSGAPQGLAALDVCRVKSILELEFAKSSGLLIDEKNILWDVFVRSYQDIALTLPNCENLFSVFLSVWNIYWHPQASIFLKSNYGRP